MKLFFNTARTSKNTAITKYVFVPTMVIGYDCMILDYLGYFHIPFFGDQRVGFNIYTRASCA